MDSEPHASQAAPLRGATSTRQRMVAFDRCSNFRDLGGYRVGDSRVTRWGLVYRSGTLHRLSPADLATFERLGIRAVFDLRTTSERATGPAPVNSVHLPVSDDLAAGELVAMLSARSAVQAEEAVARMYIAALDHGAAVFGALLGHLADGSALPALFHCTAGKDRTGLAAALLLGALGADRATVIEDYVLTATVPAPEAETYRPALLAAGVPSEAADVFLGARPGPMARVLDELDGRYGGVQAYLAGPAGVGTATLARLRDLLTEPGDQAPGTLGR